MHLDNLISVIPIPAFNDNYIWLLVNSASNNAIVVDPGTAKPVLEVLQQKKLKLCAMLITHHHADHTGGIAAILEHHPDIPIYRPDNCVANDIVKIPECNLDFTVIETPGHTLDHIVFVAKQILFCGDTLFAGGCGRLFEGTAAQLLHSLHKLASLPPATQVYCAHEYTLDNLRFALTVEPNNLALRERFATTQDLRHNARITLPSRIEIELLTNPFLRTKETTIKEAVEQFFDKELKTELEVFAMLRKWKDNFV
ncbi:MAG: hydroxyacylglutathione hydrolase [Thiotrichales bacterium]|nr:MAG: hydroxyacylglutathione hydrolase [Thiotrichales bacterium]